MSEVRWTAKDVAERLEEAARTLRRLPPVKVRGYIGTWPPVICGFWEAYGSEATKLRLGPPAPDAIDRLDEVLRWLLILEPDEVRLVWLRAEGVRWKSISYRFGMDRSTAWRHWSYALIKIAAQLNGAHATKTLQQKSMRHEQLDLAE